MSIPVSINIYTDALIAYMYTLSLYRISEDKLEKKLEIKD